MSKVTPVSKVTPIYGTVFYLVFGQGDLHVDTTLPT